MVLSQGFLNLLLWDPENEEFPEVGRAGPATLFCTQGFRQGPPLLTACPPSSDPAEGQSPAAGAGVAAAPVNRPGRSLAGGQQFLWQCSVRLTSVCG